MRTLNFEKLESLGASGYFLHQWLHGYELGFSDRTAKIFKNHRSLRLNEGAAAREWVRLEKKGKVVFYPTGEDRPRGLNVNPCALLLKPRKDVGDDAPEEQPRSRPRLEPRHDAEYPALYISHDGVIQVSADHWDGTTDLPRIVPRSQLRLLPDVLMV